MAFEFLRAENDAAPIEKEIIATNGTTYKHGVLVSFGSAGTAVVSSGTAVPEFVYAGKDITAKTGDKLAVIPVLPEYEFETTLSAPGTTLVPGSKVTTTGEQATATTTSGVFQLLTAGGASGAKVVGRFA
jgi:hypothetical protein